MLVDCDAELEQLLQELPTQVDPQQKPLPEPAKKRQRRDNEAHFDLRTHCYRVLGVDLTAVPGLQALSAHQLVAEVGPDLSKFRHGGAFASWLGLCPHNDVSGGKILARGTRKVKNRLASALRQAAQTLARDRSYLGEYYRRLRGRLGPAAAVTATAHKLARIIYHLVSRREAYDETVFAREQHHQQRRTRARFEIHARRLGYQLVPLQASVESVP